MVDKKAKYIRPMKSILPKINSFLANTFQGHAHHSSQIHPLLPNPVPKANPVFNNVQKYNPTISSASNCVIPGNVGHKAMN